MTLLCFSCKIAPFHTKCKYRNNVSEEIILSSIFFQQKFRTYCTPEQCCWEGLVKVGTKYDRISPLPNSLFAKFTTTRFVLESIGEYGRADYNGRPSAVCRVKRSCVRSIVALVGHCVRSVQCGAGYVAISAVPITTAYTTQLYDGWQLSSVSGTCLLYTSPSPRDATLSRMPSSA